MRNISIKSHSSRLPKKRKIVIPIAGLKVGMEVVELDRPWIDTPFILEGITIRSLSDIDEIAKYCEHVYIETTESLWFDKKSRNLQRTQQRYPQVSAVNTNKQIKEATSLGAETRQLTRSFMDDVRLGRAINVKEINTTVSACVKSILQSPHALMWTTKLHNKDESEASHAVDVLMLAVSFGRHLGISEEDLNKLGIAGLLHDIGKVRIPKHILQSTDTLSRDELELLRSHPTIGRDILIAHTELHHSAADVAYCHHETFNGSGYPRKIKASGISDITRMIAICDIYQDISVDHCYKKGRSSLQAMKILYQLRGSTLDEKLVQEFISCIGLYPPGSIVELRSGEVGIVISSNHRYRHLPKVLVLLARNKTPRREIVINLAETVNIPLSENIIKDLLPNGAFGIRVENYIKNGLILG